MQKLFIVTSSSKYFGENSELLMKPERSQQNKNFSNQHFISITIRMGIIGFQNIVFPYCSCHFLPTSIQN